MLLGCMNSPLFNKEKEKKKTFVRFHRTKILKNVSIENDPK